MIRTAAALFAKKTAIVAISGAVIVGGAAIALAEGDADTGDTSTPTTTEVAETTTTTIDDTTTTTTTIDESTTTTTAAPELQQTIDDEPVVADAEHPENHGKYVSEAATRCHEDVAAGTYGNHGECVREVARSDAGKGGATEVEAEGDAEDDDDADAITVEEPAAEPGAAAHAGGAGKGGGGKK